jgi:putative ABC transport system permease protein
MKFLPLVWAGLWRRKGRTALNLVSILAAFTLFATLQGISALLSGGAGNLQGNRLIVLSQDEGVLPIAYRDRILQVPGVVAVDYRNYFRGEYQKPSQTADGFAVDTHNFFQTSTEFQVSTEAIADLTASRRGMLADVRLMQKYNWKIGDQIMLKSLYDPTSGDGAGNWVFDIVGTFTLQNNPPYEPFLFNNEYFDQGRQINKGTVGSFDVVIDDAGKAAEISQTIDAMFANSPAETHTQSLYAYVQDQIKKIGDINYIIHAVLGAVFFTLLFSIGSVMMRAIQDRTPELAVLKTIGFSNRDVASLLYAENLLLSLTGVALALVAACLLLPLVAKRLNTSFVGLPGTTILETLAIAVIFALVIGLWPVRRAMRIEIVDAISGR